MFMLKVPTKQDKTWVYGTPNDQGEAVAQNIIQKFLIFVAIGAIPVMLLAKPYIKYKAHKGRVSPTVLLASITVTGNVDDTLRDSL